MEVVADLPVSSKQQMGYSALELIVDCEFAGSECTVRYVQGRCRVMHISLHLFPAGMFANGQCTGDCNSCTLYNNRKTCKQTLI